MDKNLLRATIRNFEPYEIPAINEPVVINANESPYNIFDFASVKADFASRLERMTPQCYPDGFASELRAALGEYVSCRPEEILVGNGGDEIISLIMNTFLNPGDVFLTHTPTFSVPAIDAEVMGAKIVKIPDLPGFRRDLEGFLNAVKELRPKLTMLCNPNNPTGELLPLSRVEEVVKASSGIVAVDEAYIEFSGQESVISKLADYDNLIVIRTLSKAFGLAGVRVGYAVAQKELIEALSLTKLAYNMNLLSQTLALSAMACRGEILAHNVPPTIQAREYLFGELNAIPGVTAYPSAGNFVLARVPDVAAMLRALSEAGICVRSYGGGELGDCLRVTATTMDVMRRVAEVFKKEAASCAPRS